MSAGIAEIAFLIRVFRSSSHLLAAKKLPEFHKEQQRKTDDFGNHITGKHSTHTTLVALVIKKIILIVRKLVMLVTTVTKVT
jgi:hypothetical protein